MNLGFDFMKRNWRLGLLVPVALVAVACPTPPSPTTTTTSSTSSSSVPGGPCDGYTPTNVALSTSSTTSGSTITVSGNGSAGSTVEISVLDDTDTATGVTGNAVVAGDGTWEANITLTGLVDGSYTVAATVNDDCTATAALTIIP